MKKIVKFLGIALLTMVLFFFIFYLIKNEKLPEGIASAEADQMAMDMMTVLNKAAWDTTTIVSWTFRGNHHYRWNKEMDWVNAIWDDYEVILEPSKKDGSIVGHIDYSDEERAQILKTAWDNFNNDSFWLSAPFKAFDPGTQRSIVTCKDGRQGLMVTYTSGGSTPGDSYVWILDENNRPTSVKMWVSILPIGGIEFSWENYQRLGSGALVAQDHFLGGIINVRLADIR